jgi:hypothetical protein
MWAFFSGRLRLWLLVAVALPLARAVVHRLALRPPPDGPAGDSGTAHQAVPPSCWLALG